MAEKAKQSFLDIVVPVADYQDENESASTHPSRPRSLKGKTVALLPNFRAISSPFLEALAQRLAKETGVKRAFMRDRSDWAFNHPERAGKIGRELDAFARE